MCNIFSKNSVMWENPAIVDKRKKNDTKLYRYHEHNYLKKT